MDIGKKIVNNPRSSGQRRSMEIGVLSRARLIVVMKITTK